MSEIKKSQMYSEFLAKAGLQPTIDVEGDVIFKKNGGTYLIISQEEDPTYFRLVFPNFWKINDENDRRLVLEACDQSNAVSKGTKIYTVKNDVWASLEIFLPAKEDFSKIFDRSLSSIHNAVANFVEKMREAKKEIMPASK